MLNIRYVDIMNVSKFKSIKFVKNIPYEMDVFNEPVLYA